MPRRSATHLLWTGLALAALAVPVAAAGELWRWTDADGVVRFTPDPDRVPVARRSTLVPVEAGLPPAPPRDPALANPPAIFAPPGDPTRLEDPWSPPEPTREIEGRLLRDPDEIVIEVPSGAPLAAPPGPDAQTHEEPAEQTLEEPAARTLEEPAARTLEEPAAQTPAVAAAPSELAASEPPRRLSPDEEARRAEIVAAIARDEEVLKAHVSSSDDPSIVASPELRAIAERLPALQAELRALDAQGSRP